MPSKFDPGPNETILLKGETYLVLPHPSAIGTAFSAEGRRATVYGISKKTSGDLYALKVFKTRYRTVSLVESARRLKQFENFEGMLAARRDTIDANESIVRTHPDLLYAMLMPWAGGLTWFDVLAEARDRGPVLDSYTGLALCRRLLVVMSELENVGVSHTDISPGNVAVDPDAIDVQLLDLEDLYVPGASPPKEQNKGSAGYNHPNADLGQSTWCKEGDRYATAVLACEMLLAADPMLSSRASDTGFFGGNRTSKSGCEMFEEAYPYLQTKSPTFAPLFNRAWNSKALSDCPTARDLLSAITRDGSLAPKQVVGVQWGSARVASPARAMQGARSSVSAVTRAASVTSGPNKSGSATVSGAGFTWGGTSPATQSPQSSKSPPFTTSGSSVISASSPTSSGSTAGSASPSSVVKATGPSGMGGWLALFVFSLILVNPLSTLLILSSLNPTFVVLSLAFAVFSVVAGICLMAKRSAVSVRIAKWFLGFALLYGAAPFVLVLSADLPEDARGDLIWSAVGGFVKVLIYVAVWLSYLGSSKRIRATYGTI